MRHKLPECGSWCPVFCRSCRAKRATESAGSRGKILVRRLLLILRQKCEHTNRDVRCESIDCRRNASFRCACRLGNIAAGRRIRCDVRGDVSPHRDAAADATDDRRRRTDHATAGHIVLSGDAGAPQRNRCRSVWPDAWIERQWRRAITCIEYGRRHRRFPGNRIGFGYRHPASAAQEGRRFGRLAGAHGFHRARVTRRSRPCRGRTGNRGSRRYEGHAGFFFSGVVVVPECSVTCFLAARNLLVTGIEQRVERRRWSSCGVHGCDCRAEHRIPILPACARVGEDRCTFTRGRASIARNAVAGQQEQHRPDFRPATLGSAMDERRRFGCAGLL